MNKLMPGYKRTLRSLVALVVILLIPMQAWAATVEPLDVGYGDSLISVSGTSVSYGGSSASAVTEDTITVISYLQREQGTTWITVDSVSKSANNASYVSVSKNVTVTGGYYYRTRSYHQSSTDGVVYGFYSYSSSKWVS